MRLLNDPAPWWGLSPPSPYSMVDLLASGTVSEPVAGLLWWAVERGASVLVAAGPRGAGKTTLATTLFSFLPAGAPVYITRGRLDHLDVPLDGPPPWLLVNELSDHLPSYLHGDAARRAFALIERGARIVGSLHALSADTIAWALERDAGVPESMARLVDLGVVLTVRRTPAGIDRRVTEVALLRDRDQPAPLTVWNAGEAGAVLTPEGGAALAAWAGADEARVRADIGERAALLVATGRRGLHTRDDVTAAVRHFRRTRGLAHGPT